MSGAPRKIKFVIGPDGAPMCIGDLPDAHKRFTIVRKQAIVCAVRGGLLTVHEACERYRLSLEEYMLWCSAIDAGGRQHMRVTKIQKYSGRRRVRAAEASA